MTHQEIKELLIACRNETKIGFQDTKGFFSPRFKSVHHIQLGGSQLISGVLAILLEFFYEIFKRMRNQLEKLKALLFPRSEKLFGENRNSLLRGKVTFSMKNGLAKPIHHMDVAFWARTWWLQWRKLGVGLTDDQGNYQIAYDRKAAKKADILNLRMEVYQTTRIYFKDGCAVPHNTLIHKKWVRKDDLSTESVMLENFRMDFWEYREDYPTPRVLIKNLEKDAPQHYSEARQDALVKQFIPYELIKAKHLKMLESGSKKIDLAYIQQDYPINLSRCIEEKIPGYTRTDEYFGHRQMNGMNRASFLPDPENPDHYLVKYFGACRYQVNDSFAFPDATIQFKLDEEGLPLPTEISLTGPLTSFEKNPWKKNIFTPSDGEAWESAKRIARVSGSICTEVDDHFTGTHLNTEQYAIAAYRNLRINPIANLLLPHLKEVVLINHSADKLLLRDFLPSASAMTEKGLKERTKDLLGVQDWKGYQPMDPISPVHDVAATDKLFWKITQQYVDDFIDTHLEEIKNYWLEIYCFSQDLVEHSVPVFLSDLDLTQLSPDQRNQAEERFHYYQFKYGYNPTLKRALINGEMKAVSPITTHNGTQEITENDIQNLKESCVYIIFVATYLHTWINEHQYDELGELLFNGLGLRFGASEQGIMAPESDLQIAPNLTSATEMLWFVNLLSRTEFGFITRNEDEDVNPAYSKMLMNKKEEFLRLGVEVENIESRTNI